MEERAACVLVIGVQPALFELADALEEFELEVIRTTKVEEVTWLLRIWSGACVAVLDAGLPGSDTFAAIHHRLHLAPPVPTLIVFDQDLALSARDLAARDAFAQLPLTTAELVIEVAMLLQRLGIDLALPDSEALEPEPERTTAPLIAASADHTAEMMAEPGQVVTLLSLKGGVGRSTIAVNLAVALAHWYHKRVILVDADLWRGDLSVLLNLPVRRGMADLVPRPNELLDLETVQAALQTHSSGVRLLPAPSEATLVETIPPLLPARLVQVCKGLADYVIVDTPPALDDLALHILDVSDLVLGVLVPEVSAARHTSRLLELSPQLQLGQRLKLVLNRANSGLSAQQLETLLVRGVEARLVSAGVQVLQAANQGMPLIDTPTLRNSGIVRDFARLAALVAGEPPPAEQLAAPKRRRVARPLFGLLRPSAPETSS